MKKLYKHCQVIENGQDNRMKLLITISTLFLVVFSAGCRTVSGPIVAGSTAGGQRVFVACEMLRSADPAITRQGVSELFSIGGLEAYTLLHLKWIAEPNPEIRMYILEGFSQIGDHRHIADPSFPHEWIKAAMRFPSPEKDTRLRELKKYFPKDIDS